MYVQLRRDFRLLAHYLRFLWLRMGGLSVILCSTTGVQVVTPLVASSFIDQTTTGADLHDLTALAGQGLAVAETYVAEHVSWAATNELLADLVAHLLRLDATFHTAHTPGELIERVDGDVATLARFFSRFVVSVLGNGLLLLSVLGLLYHVDWRVGLHWHLTVQQREEVQRVKLHAVDHAARLATWCCSRTAPTSAPRIATVHDCRQDVMRLWLHHDNTEGRAGLDDESRSGLSRKDGDPS